jgi:glycosyltransferase involved in cell wall biosynthesis
MRILLANTAHPSHVKGGAEAAVLDLAKRLVQRGHSVALVTHHKSWKGSQSEEDGVRLYNLGNRNIYYAFKEAKSPAPLRFLWHSLDSANPFMEHAFGRILDQEKPDIVNTHVLVGLSQGLWRAVKKRNIPLIHYLHEYGALCPRGSTFNKGALCLQQCRSCATITQKRRELSNNVDSIVGVSRYTLDRHLDWGYFTKAKPYVLPNVFNNLAFTGRASARLGPMRIGYFGRLIPDKGAHLLIEAVKNLPQGGWTLDIAGTGDADYIQKLKAMAGANVRFLGWRKAEEFFTNIDVMVLPSLWPDPQPRVTFEAYMYGVPVIGARAGGIPEQIVEGRTGWLFEAGSVSSLTDVLGQRLSDRDDQSLPTADFEERLIALDPDKVALAYEQAYQETIENLEFTQKALAEHTKNI